MRACLDSWAVIAWLDGLQPAAARVTSAVADRPVMSWMNVVEVYYLTERRHGRGAADMILARLRERLDLDLPQTGRMIESARLKARLRVVLAGCFAIATAAAFQLPLLTGDPEILDAPDLPCSVVDLRN